MDDEIPAVTPAQMAEVDRIMADEFGVEPLQLMEVAGRSVAHFIRTAMFEGDPRGKRVVLLCGPGGNGGDGLVAARYLSTWDVTPEVWISQWPDPERGITHHQLESARRFGIPIHQPAIRPVLPEADLIVDALLGFSASGAPRDAAAALILAANEHPAAKLAVDLPSGLSGLDGTVYEPCFRADTTLTLALPKTGLLTRSAQSVVGALVAADIGVPDEAFRKVGVAARNPYFAAEYREIT